MMRAVAGQLPARKQTSIIVLLLAQGTPSAAVTRCSGLSKVESAEGGVR
jgi:hypothetical protein